MPNAPFFKGTQAHSLAQGLTALFTKTTRTPLVRTPEQYGMAYETVVFPSLDGVRLEGWLIPADSDRLVLCSHFAGANRYGFPGHVKPWSNLDDREVNLLPMYRALHDRGYNILTFDLRNHGESGGDGVLRHGMAEYRDVVAASRYAWNREKTQAMKTVVLGFGLGCNATMVAMRNHPSDFEHVLALVAVQPVFMRQLVQRGAQRAGISYDQALFDREFRRATGYTLDAMSPLPHATGVKVPTLVAQVVADGFTDHADVQATVDALSTDDKSLLWIDRATRRSDGYGYFSQHPEPLLAWFDRHVDRAGVRMPSERSLRARPRVEG